LKEAAKKPTRTKKRRQLDKANKAKKKEVRLEETISPYLFVVDVCVPIPLRVSLG
jgi:hypothetical protein